MKSLLVRFFLFSLVIAACSIAVTAWLASQATTGAIRQEQGDALETDAQIFDELVHYAATHKDWAGAKSTVDGIARKYDRRIALTDGNGTTLVDTGDKNSPQLPITPKALVDPLNVNGKIDPRAVGPFKLNDEEYRTLHTYADQLLQCVSRITIVEAPNGRPRLSNLGPGELSQWDDCSVGYRLYTLTVTEKAAYGQLQALFSKCLGQRAPEGRNYDKSPGPTTFDWEITTVDGAPPEVVGCMDSSRRECQAARRGARPAVPHLTDRRRAVGDRPLDDRCHPDHAGGARNPRARRVRVLAHRHTARAADPSPHRRHETHRRRRSDGTGGRRLG